MEYPPKLTTETGVTREEFNAFMQAHNEQVAGILIALQEADKTFGYVNKCLEYLGRKTGHIIPKTGNDNAA